MALPTILVNNTGGSDTQASGAGPATAIFGNTGVTSGTGLVVDLIADTPDLSGVATDGSAVLFMSDTNAGSRNFSKITAVDNTLKTVTVSDAFQASNTDAWAIGGKRASIGSTTSRKLFENNAAAGDAMPGWIVHMESGHTETLSATLTCRRAGNATDGLITLRGADATAVLTFSNNGTAISVAASGLMFDRFALQNTNATKTASVGIALAAGGRFRARRVKIADSTNKFWKGITLAVSLSLVEECEFGYCAASGIEIGNISGARIINCWIHDSTSHGLSNTATTGNQHYIIGNLITDNGGDGIRDTRTTGFGDVIIGNTIDGNTGDGYEQTATPNQGAMTNSFILNNIFSNNGGYGMNFSGASMSDMALVLDLVSIRGNDFYQNTSGECNLSPFTISEEQQTLDPQYTNAGSNDFSIGTNLKAKGYPVGGSQLIGTYSATYSYVDPGVSQRQEPTGGSGSAHIIGA